MNNKLTLRRRIISGATWGVVSEIISKGLLLVANIYIARKLSIANFGLLSLATTVTTYFWIGADLGINMYGSRHISLDRSSTRDIVRLFLGARLVSGFAFFLLFVVGTTIFAKTDVERVIFYCSSIYLLSRAVSLDWALRGLERFDLVAVGETIIYLSMMLFVFIAVNGPDDIYSSSLARPACMLLGGIVHMYLLSHITGGSLTPKFDIGMWGYHLRESFHFIVSGGMMALYQSLPIILITTVSTGYYIGIYSASYKIVTAATVAMTILSRSLFPILSDLSVSNRMKFNRLRRMYLAFMAFVGIAFGVFCTVFSDTIIDLVYGSKYAESIASLRMLAWFAALLCIRSAQGIVISSCGLQRYYSIISVISTALLIIMFYALNSLTHLDVTVLSAVALTAAEAFIVMSFAIVWRYNHQRFN